MVGTFTGEKETATSGAIMAPARTVVNYIEVSGKQPSPKGLDFVG